MGKKGTVRRSAVPSPLSLNRSLLNPARLSRKASPRSP